MATLAATNPTLTDVAKLKEPDGGIITDVVEMQAQDNELLLDSTWMEANGGTFHRSSQRVGIPDPTWREFYQGVLPSKSTYAQLDEPLGMMEARAQIDQKLADMATNPAQFRLIEAGGHIEGMNQALVATALYGSVTTSPAKFNGLAPRFNSLSAASGENIIDAGGTSTDNTSIWLINWSPRTVFFAYPRGSTAGISRVDLGINHHARPPDGSAGEFSAYEEKFTQEVGLVVRDWRHVVRAANIDKSNLVGETSAADILKLMTTMVHKLPSQSGGRMAFYVNRTVISMLDIQAQNKANVYLTTGNEEGRAKVSFRGIPIRKVDQILNTEDRVV